MRQAQGRCAIECLKFLQRFNLHTKHPSEWAIVRSHADLVLQEAWKKCQHLESMDVKVFCNLHKKLLAMIIPEADLGACLVETSDWVTIKQHLFAVVSGSKVGDCLFGWAVGKVVSAQVHDIVEARVRLLYTLETLDHDSLSAHLSETLRLCSELPNLDRVESNREVLGGYRTLVLRQSVSSLATEVSFKYACAWKALAVKQGLLPKLELEKFMQLDGDDDDDIADDDNAMESKPLIDAALVVEAAIARQTADAATIGAGIVGADKLRAVVTHLGTCHVPLIEGFDVLSFLIRALYVATHMHICMYICKVLLTYTCT